jgi:CheY-like chemotaxis protein
MATKVRRINMLMADDDLEDQLLTSQALEESKLFNPIHFVNDGEELMDYLKHRGKYSAPGSASRPGLILLDLNMPRKDGRRALEEIKADKHIKAIPVVVLTTSSAEEDRLRSYELGASGYITKPIFFEALLKAMLGIRHYWLEIVELPRSRDES